MNVAVVNERDQLMYTPLGKQDAETIFANSTNDQGTVLSGPGLVPFERA